MASTVHRWRKDTLALGSEARPAVLRLLLPFRSCSRCFSRHGRAGLVSSACQQRQPLMLPTHESLAGLTPCSGGQFGVAGRRQLSLQVLEHVEREAADHGDS